MILESRDHRPGAEFEIRPIGAAALKDFPVDSAHEIQGQGMALGRHGSLGLLHPLRGVLPQALDLGFHFVVTDQHYGLSPLHLAQIRKYDFGLHFDPRGVAKRAADLGTFGIDIGFRDRFDLSGLDGGRQGLGDENPLHLIGETGPIDALEHRPRHLARAKALDVCALAKFSVSAVESSTHPCHIHFNPEAPEHRTGLVALHSDVVVYTACFCHLVLFPRAGHAL